jgi:hypothetical protein
MRRMGRASQGKRGPKMRFKRFFFCFRAMFESPQGQGFRGARERINEKRREPGWVAADVPSKDACLCTQSSDAPSAAGPTMQSNAVRAVHVLHRCFIDGWFGMENSPVSFSSSVARAGRQARGRRL